MPWKKVVGPGSGGSGGNFQGLYYTNSVINGPTFDSQGSGQAAYLQIKSETSPSILQIKSGTPPLQVQFADGINNGERQSILSELGSTVEKDVSGKSAGTYQVWANYDSGSLSFSIETPVNTTRSFDQPSSPSSGDTWLDMENNLYKKWNGSSWVEEKKALMGRIGIGTDNQIYTTTALPMIPELEKEMETYINYDGVILATDGQYLTENASKWVDTQSVVDDVINSNLALDAVTSSSNTMDAVAGSSTAMDAVSSSSTAMDAVSSSSTAMDAVLRAPTGRDSVWSSDLASEAIWKNTGTPAPPHSYDSDFSLSLVEGYNGGKAIRIQGVDPGNSGERYWETNKLNLTGVSTLKIATKKSTTMDGTDMKMRVEVGGNTVFESVESYDPDFGWTVRSIDVSGYSGKTKVEMGWKFTSSGYSGEFNAYFDDIKLIK